MNGFQRLEEVIGQIENSKSPFDIKHVRDGYIMIQVATPGKRWEIEVNAEGEVEVEVFVSDGKILDASDLNALWQALR